MATVPEAFATALRHHQAGQLQAAEQMYRQIPTIEPDHAAALHYLEMLTHQLDRHEEAIDLMARAIELAPNNARIPNDLGTFLRQLGKLEEAVDNYRRALQINPNVAEALGFFSSSQCAT